MGHTGMRCSVNAQFLCQTFFRRCPMANEIIAPTTAVAEQATHMSIAMAKGACWRLPVKMTFPNSKMLANLCFSFGT